MATYGFPKWLLDGKEEITHSKEWSVFVEELYDAIQQQLKESHVHAFTDLTAPERQLFMERAANAIHSGKPYGDLYDKVSESLDKRMNNEVSRQLLEDYPINTKTHLILDAAQEGAVSLLQKWPQMKSKLHICFNQPLPKSLRQLVWKLYLENTKVRKKYVDLLASNPRSAISRLDFEISQKCEQLLLSEPTFSDLKGSVGVFYAMKAVLSYHHATKKIDSGLSDIDYLLMIPFVNLSSSNLSRREPAASHIVALLVEEYSSFLHSRPGYIVDSGSEEHDRALIAFCRKVAQNLLQHSPETASVLTEALIPDKEKISATDSGTVQILSDVLLDLVRPLIRIVFVGFVNLDVLMFLWDQYVIGIDAPGFHDEYLPAVTAIFFILLREKLKNCHSAPAIEAAMRKEGAVLTVPQFQYEIKKYFGQNLHKLLNQDDRAALPVLDPTQANYRPWVYWFSDNIPARTTPQERRLARDEREAERQRIDEQRKETELRSKQEQDQRRFEEEQKMLGRMADDKRRQQEDKIALEHQLQDERRHRLEVERDAQNEIERLKQEIEDLKRQPTPVHSLESAISQYLIPRPATRNQGPPLTPRSESKIKTPRASSPPNKQADDVLLDLMKRVSTGFYKVSQGNDKEKQELDEETRRFIMNHKDDVKQAEVEVFGHHLQPGEFEKLTPREQKQNSDKIMDVLRQKLQERREAELKQSRQEAGSKPDENNK